MPTSLPFLLGPAELPPAELQAACLDGDLVDVAGLFAPADVAGTVDLRGARELRARALLHVVPAALVAEQTTAAWLHGAWPTLPAPLELCVRSDHRVRAGPSPSRSVRQVVLGRGELLELGGLLVTTPRRTAIDLLRLPAVFTRRHRDAVTTLLLMRDDDGVAECRAALFDSSHLPHKQRALDRLTALSRR
jgi:hypothetical protein